MVPANLPRHPGSISPRQIRSIAPAARPVILEIGCNDGTDSLNLLTIPNVRLHCFECDPRPIARFCEKVLRMPPPDDDRVGSMSSRNAECEVTLYLTAVGRETGKATFHQSGGTTEGAHLKDWDLSGSLKKPAGHLERHKWCKFENEIEVDVTTLDEWRREQQIGTIDFIWLDVQGAEGDVFAGGKHALQNTRFLYCEFNDYKKPLYEGDLNYEQTLAALGPDWKTVGLFEGYNLLLQNVRVAREVPIG